MELCTLIFFVFGEVEKFLQLLYLDADEVCLGYKERCSNPINE